MTDQKSNALDDDTSAAKFDVGRPVEWMVDPDHREKILGVTYECFIVLEVLQLLGKETT